MEKHHIVQWRPPGGGDWIRSTLEDRPTEEQARRQLASDVGYFYSDIEVRLVRVTEEVVEEHHGSNERPADMRGA